ncbi:hypothetical protein JNB_11814 [Janibacter sp. HTCC2649]|uniref:hypothetical protein n=1 Tax=Janibacter sp. HTCC2649 TaxID=313589 RepID=UPI00006709D8|nr:hypothetical protein [Janibacter sp. HTCC2649]EAQ00860.1 hypothetical protein JNB_11814 [Janibacter sp. HTCC2649]
MSDNPQNDLGDKEPKPLLETLRFEPRMEAHLRESLVILRDDSDDRALRKRIDDVLAGRASLRDLARSADFTAVIDSKIDRAVEEFDAIPEAEREADLQRAIAEAHTPPPAEPPTRRDDPGTW